MTEAPQEIIGELEDFFEGGGGGYPTFSLKMERVGAKFGGYVVPVSATEPNKTHVTTPQTNIEGVVQYWPQKPGETVKRPRPQAEINFQTEYRNQEFMSEKAIKRLVENEQQDDGLRRWIVKGKSATEGLKSELRRLGINRAAPPPGSYIEVTLTDRKELPNQKTENVWGVKVTAPTEKGRQIVANHLAMLAEQGDPEGTGDGSDQEDPPF
jgi:hypothetical protein